MKRYCGLIALCVVVGVGCYLACAYVRLRPRVQLTLRTLASVSIALEDYVADHGRLPAGWGDMAAAGYLVKRSVPLEAKGDYERTGVYQLPKRYGEIVLYYLDDIVLNKAANTSDLAISGDRLLNRQTGEETFIIGHKSFTGAGV